MVFSYYCLTSLLKFCSVCTVGTHIFENAAKDLDLNEQVLIVLKFNTFSVSSIAHDMMPVCSAVSAVWFYSDEHCKYCSVLLYIICYSYLICYLIKTTAITTSILLIDFLVYNLKIFISC